MRTLIVTEFITLDGVVEDPGTGDWHFQYFSEQAGKYKFDELMECDAQLLGRVTYEGFAQAWPSVEDEAGFAEKMNTIPKYVVSSTLKDPEWENTTVLGGDMAGSVRELKETKGGPILVGGSPTLVQGMLAEGLVDELRLMVHPIAVGQGKRLFAEGHRTELELIETTPLDSGIVILVYHRAGS